MKTSTFEPGLIACFLPASVAARFIADMNKGAK